MALAASAAEEPKAAPKSKADKKDDEKILKQARDRWEAAIEADDENHRNYVSDVDFSSTNDQWDPEVKKKRGSSRPALTINRLNAVIKQIEGDYRQHKLAIKVLPASGDASVDTAETIAGIIRNIEAQSCADMAYTVALNCSARGGFGAFRVVTAYTGDDVFDQDILIRPIHNPLTVHFDPKARLITREDADYCFVSEMMKRDAFKAQYHDVEIKQFNDDDSIEWCNEDEIRVAEYFEKAKYKARIGAFNNGMVTEIKDDAEIYAMEQIGFKLIREREANRTKIIWRKLTGNKILETREYMTKYIPIIPVIGEEVNVEGKVKTRSAIYYAKDPQRMYNYWKSTATEAVALAPKSRILVTPEQIQGHEGQWANANNDPSPYLIYNFDPSAGKPDRLDPAQVPVAEISLGLNAADDIKATTGIYDASLGARSNETSGVAIEARQQEGNTATYLFIDNLKQSIEYCGRVIVDLIPTVYDAERVVRVLDLEGNSTTEVINQEQHDPMTGITQILNSVTVGKYDVVIEAGPSFASRRREAVAGMVDMARAFPQAMGSAVDLIIKNMDFPGAQEVAERVKRTLPPHLTADSDSPEAQQLQQQQQQAQEQAMQMEMESKQTDLAIQKSKQTAEEAKSAAAVVQAQADIANTTNPEVAPRAQPDGGPPPPVSHHPPQSPVSIQFNAENALANVATHMGAIAEAQVAQSQNVAQTLKVISDVLTVTQQTNSQQSTQIATLLDQNAKTSTAIASALQRQNEIAAAPRRAVRDDKGKIIAAVPDLNPTEKMNGHV